MLDAIELAGGRCFVNFEVRVASDQQIANVGPAVIDRGEDRGLALLIFALTSAGSVSRSARTALASPAPIAAKNSLVWAMKLPF